jgi:hypothetical protein
VGYGSKKPRLPCGGNHHHWRRRKEVRYRVSKPVGLDTPLPSDFCSHCQVVREQLEVSA